MKSQYNYSFLRYRQDPEAEEFANIGIALWAPESRFLGFQGSSRYSRLTHFFGDLDREGYRLLVAHVERRFDSLAQQLSQNFLFDSAPPSLEAFTHKALPQDDGSVIWGPPRGGFTEDPNHELSRLFRRYIERAQDSDEKPRRDEGTVFREVFRNAFSQPSIASKLQEREIVAPLAHHTFKHAWKNGVWNVYETISFDMVEAESIERKAHTWFGRSIHLADSPDKPQIHYLLGKPSLCEHAGSYAQAKQILTSAGNVKVVGEEEAEDFATALQIAVARSV